MRTLLAGLVSILLVAELRALDVEDLPAIRDRGVLRVVVPTEDRVAVAMFAPGSMPGFDREIIEGFAALQRLRVEFVRAASADRIPTLLAGKGDVVLGLVNTEARRKQVDFTVEVFPNRHLVITRRPHVRIDTLEQLRQSRVGTTKGSSWAEAVVAAGVPRKNIDDSYTNADEVHAALRTGRIEAAVVTVNTAFLERKKDPELELGLFVGPLESAAFAVRPGARELLKVIDEYVTNLRHSPTWSRLVVKYYGDEALEVLQKSRAGAEPQ
jgi:lysine/arginine/ornithine transport system substrate-binding protein